MAQQNTKASASGTNKARTVLGIVLTVLLLPVLIFNLAVMVQSVRHQVPPKLFGHYVAVLPNGDLAFFQETDPHYFNEMDTIAFLERDGSVSAGQVLALSREGTEISSIQVSGGQGSALYDVSPDETFGKMKLRIPFVGRFILFLDNDIGALVAIGLPLIGALIYDIRRRKMQAALRSAEEEPETEEPDKKAPAVQAAAPAQEAASAPAEKAAEPASAPAEKAAEPASAPAEKAAEPAPAPEEKAAEPAPKEEHSLMDLFYQELQRTETAQAKAAKSEAAVAEAVKTEAEAVKPAEAPAKAEAAKPAEAPAKEVRAERPKKPAAEPEYSDRGFKAGRALKWEEGPDPIPEPELAAVENPVIKVKAVARPKPAVKPEPAEKKAAVKVKPRKVAGRKERGV
ncbi:MAG: hypothetical protein IIZ60_06670 [Clostridia bacterium]|nr:hypothetical protein [Clostridia bacterium]